MELTDGFDLIDPGSYADHGALVPRLERLEPAGDADYIRSSFVAGLKRLPIRYRIAPSS